MISASLGKKHFAHNIKTLSQNGFFGSDGKSHFVEDQARWSDIKYGWYKRSNMARSGCGVIAVWNLLHYFKRIPGIGAPAAFSNLIYDMERCATVFGGALGTSVIPIFFYIKKYFKHVHMSPRFSREYADDFGRRHDAFIVIAFNNISRITDGMHLVCITRDKYGYMIHNCYRRLRTGRYISSRRYRSLSDALDNMTEKPLVTMMIGVAEKEESHV